MGDGVFIFREGEKKGKEEGNKGERRLKFISKCLKGRMKSVSLKGYSTRRKGGVWRSHTLLQRDGKMRKALKKRGRKKH